MMADHIPFLYRRNDCGILSKRYSDSVAVRLSLDTIQNVFSALPSGPLRWLDPAIDGIDKWKNPKSVSEDYKLFIQKFSGSAKITDASFQKNPEISVVKDFTWAVLDECTRLFKPDWLSVLTLPLASDSSRNKITRNFAEATASWKSDRQFRGKLILPIIITHISEIKLKVERQKRIKLITDSYAISGASGIWVVDRSLADQEGAQPLESIRFPKLIEFHQELCENLPKDMIAIAGPYWGMNLILWARGLVKYPAVSLGKSYQYHSPGGKLRKSSERVALPPLKRWAVANSHLHKWLGDALKIIPKDDSAHAELYAVLQNFARLTHDGREQVANFYKDWFNKIAAVSEPGRALALFQDFSSAYALGKGLPDIPMKGPGRKAAQVAKQFMVNCL
jgi:hypothetical protein